MNTAREPVGTAPRARRRLFAGVVAGGLAAAFLAATDRADAATPRRELVLVSEALAFCGDRLPADVAAFLRRVETVARWPAGSLSGRGFARPADALAYLRKKRPAFALLPLHAFVQARKDLALEPVGRAVGLEGDEPSFWVIAARDKARGWEHIEFRPGLKLAGDDLGDARWLADVIFETNLRTPPDRHFILMPVDTPPLAVGAVTIGQADAALVYESEMRRHLDRLTAGGELVEVYASAPMPPPPVVALGRSASAVDRKALAAAFKEICLGDGRPLCERLGILRFEAGKADTYDALVAKYSYLHPVRVPARK